MGVVSGLTLDRVRSDVEVLARAGLDTATFLSEVDASLQRAVPHAGACIATVDPASHLLTGTYKFGDLAGRDDKDHDWGLIEYGDPDPTTFVSMINSGTAVCTAHQVTGGDPVRLRRMGDLITPHFGYSDELRMVACDGERGWGGIALFRAVGDDPFSTQEAAYMASLSAHVAAGLRSGLLVRMASTTGADHGFGPSVLIVGADDQLNQVSVGAERVLADLTRDVNMAPATGIIGGLVAGARRYAAGLADVLPRTRVRLSTGRWLVMHASPLSGANGATGDVVITIEEARPPEIVPLVVAAFNLTARERDVTQLVLQGVDTKEIAAALHMSRYTVQDHLKSVFDKADVRSRRELISRIFFDQYSPRMGGELGTTGGFTATT